MAIRDIVTRGFGNGTYDPGVNDIPTRGYSIGAAVVVAALLPGSASVTRSGPGDISVARSGPGDVSISRSGPGIATISRKTS